MPLSVGDRAPDFTLVDVDGKPHTLSEYRGRKVMLSFYRFASCPMCNYAIDQLKGRHKKLAWAAKLDVIAVFQSPAENIDRSILKARDSNSRDFPFVLLSDPELQTYSLYEVGKSLRGFVAGVFRYERDRKKKYKKYPHAPFSEDYQPDGPATRLPSDFLIDEDGIIVDCFRAKVIDEHIPLDRIDRFLLGGSKSERSSSNKSSGHGSVKGGQKRSRSLRSSLSRVLHSG